MNVKKHIKVGVLSFLLIIILILFSMLYSKRTSPNVSDLIENENISDISLTIYYLDLHALRFLPVPSVEDLIQRTVDEKIVISGSELKQYIDLFRKIDNEVLIPVWNRSSDLDLRVYYVLESKKNGKLFDVAMWGDVDSVFVNGIEVKGNKVFYDVIIPFLSEKAAKDLEDFYNSVHSTEKWKVRVKL